MYNSNRFVPPDCQSTMIQPVLLDGIKSPLGEVVKHVCWSRLPGVQPGRWSIHLSDYAFCLSCGASCVHRYQGSGHSSDFLPPFFWTVL